jgi:hypothetical protein
MADRVDGDRTASAHVSDAVPRDVMRRLLETLGESMEDTATELATLFDELEKIVESLPLTSNEFCFAHNWVVGARRLSDAGDFGAAHYQLDIVRKKLSL